MAGGRQPMRLPVAASTRSKGAAAARPSKPVNALRLMSSCSRLGSGGSQPPQLPPSAVSRLLERRRQVRLEQQALARAGEVRRLPDRSRWRSAVRPAQGARVAGHFGTSLAAVVAGAT